MRRFKAQNAYLVFMLILSVFITSSSGFASAADLMPVDLGAAAPFAGFGGSSGMTNMGLNTVIKGDIGTTGAASLITGFHDTISGAVYTETPLNIGKVIGTIHTATTPLGSAPGVISAAAALSAQTAFHNLSPAALPGGIDITSLGVNSLGAGAGFLGGRTLAPGIYTTATSFAIVGADLTLDAGGNPNAVWVFQMGSTLDVGGPGAAFPQSVILAGGAQAKNVFWQVGSIATINAAGDGTMVGTIIADAGIVVSTAGNTKKVTINGRLLALNGSVTLVNTDINVPAATLLPATVSSVVPVNAAKGAAIGNKLSVTFSQAMDLAAINGATFTLKETVSGAGVAGDVSFSGVTAVFAPSTVLAPNTTYSATITTGAKDVAGSALANDFVWSFTTGAAVEAVNPTVSSTLPANGALDAALGSKITAIFSEAIDPASIATTFTLNDGINNVAGAVAYSGVTAVFTPTNALVAGAVYTATITTGTTDLAGNALVSDFVWSFTAGVAADLIVPAVASINPADAATGVAVDSKITATLSEDINPLTLTTNTFTLQQGVTPVAGTVNYSGVTAVFTPMSALEANTTYTATITTGVTDLAGNVLASNFVSSFTTAMAQVTKLAWVWSPATSANDEIYATWKVSSIPGVTYVLEEANNTNFIGAIEVYRGTALRSALIPGHANGTWYFRVKAIATGYIDSAWVVSSGEIVAVQAKKPSWIWTPATSPDDTVYATWVSSATAGVTYVLEEANNASFMGAVEIYRGTALRSAPISGHANGTWYLRVKAVATGYIDSAWAVSTGETVAVQTKKPSWIWTPATSANGNVYSTWITSTTPSVTYVVEEANNIAFSNAVQVYNGMALRSPVISGHASGTWYLRVKATAVGFIDSPWVISSGCIVP